MKRMLSAGLRACMLVALLGLLIYFRFIDLAVLWRILAHPDVLVIGAGAVSLSYMMAALRWWLLLRSQNFAITYLHAFRIYLVSIFSAIFVPGGTFSSDAVRAFMLVRMVPARRSQALLSLFAESVIAALVLSLLVAILSLAQWPIRQAASSDPIIWLNIAALLLPMALSITACGAWLITRTAKRRITQSSPNPTRIVRTIVVVADFFDLALKSRLIILLAMVASAISLGLLLGAIVIVSMVAAIPNLSFWDIAYAAALSQFANSLPISPNGIGVGEAAFNQICVWIAQSNAHYPYATIFLAYRIIAVLVACCGGIASLNVRRLMRPVSEQAYPLMETDVHVQPGNS